MLAVLYWEEPDRSGHIFGPDDDVAMGKALKEVEELRHASLCMTKCFCVQCTF